MTLSAAFNTVQTMFGNHGTQSDVITKNVANQQNTAYGRRTAVTTSTLYGGAFVTIQRAQDYALLRQSLTATSQDSAQKALATGLNRLSSIFGGNEQPFAPSTYLNNLYKSLSDYAAKPSDRTLGAAVVNNAQSLAGALNDASSAVQKVRADADREISLQVDKLNDLLRQFHEANDAVMSASAAGMDANDEMDVREGVLNKISEIVGVNVLRREPNDMVLYTSDGTTLFESSPRAVTFTPTMAYGATVAGNSIKIDGVPVTPGTGANTTGQGTLSALLQLRDEVAPVLQNQLDEMARGLVTAFAETDGGVPPTIMAGLFTYGTGAVPVAGTVVPDLASVIRVNPAVDPALGGDPSKLRDGSINGAAFNRNTGNNASFSAVLVGYGRALDTPMPFDPVAQLDSSASLMTYATKPIGWLEDIRQSATDSATKKSALKVHSAEAYSNATGVSLDEEMSLMLNLQQSYKATAQILSAIDEMIKSLLNAAG
ncbi:flagellar hook-associated protein FlgK [Gellertiella hungarica]|uniref:Flagellar hook-associated protein 1 n=1 Tax=Gellertiella hungarica TaxID=1572859 RepID=A0A7W6J3J4_9HYPH|nr:flagellar hook-associated protein FlgK [Gellertiella hungarica]MBB4064139.1 flagellar hook-associated protein 1 FlgK [Gellertiella hungarica]